MNEPRLQPNLGINGEVIESGIGIKWPRLFGEGNPYDAIKWEKRVAKIVKGDGTIVFEQSNVEVPSFWTQTATDIVASKYFRGKLDSPEREYSVKQMVDRVAKTIGEWGMRDGYFDTIGDCDNFTKDLTWILVNQYGAFNSPVWFNVGVYERPQCSACFILSVEDNMQSILDWFRDEGWIFKYGSGSGINLSKLRSSKEPLSKGGFSSGPVSFMKGADGVANSIRSGGTTRRAAKMVVLNVDHPDISSFIYSKKIIEDMTKALAQAGFKDSIAADLFDPYTLLPYQNANNSVRVTDAFMRAVEADGYWDLKSVVTGQTVETVKAKDVLRWMAEAAWHSADPGIQYDTTINEWHTCPKAGRINASNPCSEYMHLDNSACNLSSLNLMKFLREGGRFDADTFKKAVDTMILAQDILVDRSSYPTEKIENNAHAYRELGLGYANLGALLMVLGLPYDSDKGRILAGQITSLMCGEAYRMSAVLSSHKGPFAGYYKDSEGTLEVTAKHLDKAEELFNNSQEQNMDDKYLETASRTVWHEANNLAKEYGVKNSQVTVLAPTGTISFLMDCDTTGIEPELALVKYKKLVGGGTLKLVNNQIPLALRRLGYLNEEVDAISDYILDRETIEGAPYLKDEHAPVFDCSFKAANGTRSISYMGHIKMMAAAQPFISGAISKTINLPSDATIEDIEDVFFQGWRLGLKALAVYRDGCKSIQPLNTSKTLDLENKKEKGLVEQVNGYTRIKLPDERPSITHKFSVGGFESYLTVGFYPDTMQPGETFITTAKEGSTISGLFDTIATLISMCLQSGIPLKTLVRKFKDMRFEPAGFTNNPNIPTAKSIMDYVFRYIGMKYLSPNDREELFGPVDQYLAEDHGAEPIPVAQENETSKNDKILAELVHSATDVAFIFDKQGQKGQVASAQRESNIGTGTIGNGKAESLNADAPLCNGCGTIMIRAGSCYSCPNCFATTGVCN
ncbi:MAG: ribonucleoside-diphosphate reductase, adenosylcobalamin-dependent [Candidatus Yanofskybacteria bacterium RIFCSPLOWO2_01_FULL_42_49]|uniref:Vitamin B12-dependent ribonucleotide reductase n=1 Tax=Candidatus Yanofskybacteria bacterium RIFCSPLOWO2_01_FULL_42_49 TaxID=1802694 RepID=A0A1F8GDU9_9BACT|nr:MAG: ribonucleoside-diphosphate reductase, adenosylcobalamin-dependent [Candidatus Yanofskybacteria bacterium RIFCSPLOWO2_01_FULL_42_49]